MKFLSKKLACDIFGFLILALVAAGLGIYARGGCGQASADGLLAHPLVSLKELQAFVAAGRTPILDARNFSDYQRGHVPGARSLPTADFDAAFAKLDREVSDRKEDLVVVYCSNMWCGLGDELQKKLIDRGFRHVGIFRDGWEGWQTAKLPAETSAP